MPYMNPLDPHDDQWPSDWWGRRSVVRTDEIPSPSALDTVVIGRVTPRENRWYVRHPDDHPAPWWLLRAGLTLLPCALIFAWWVVIRP